MSSTRLTSNSAPPAQPGLLDASPIQIQGECTVCIRYDRTPITPNADSPHASDAYQHRDNGIRRV